MSALEPSMRRLLLWVVPIAVFALALVAELDWGRDAPHAQVPHTPPVPAPVGVGLLPDYTIPGGAAALSATSERTLFNPTRRPAPPAVAAAGSGPSQMQRGQFLLTGTAIYRGRAVAYLKEVQGGKPRTVKKGETINGMLVAEVDRNGVRLTMGGESEDLPLKVATGPKVTVQPAAPRAPGDAHAPRNGQRPGGGQRVNPANSPAPEQAMTLGERRRAARAAEILRQRAEAEAQRAGAAAGQPPQGNANGGAPSNQQPATARGANGQDPRWQQMYQRYRGRNAPPE